jgi:2-polyprenyl-3-methyl-5-hydroxy-6-metoxy-1,4-benzoquinol methylase
MLTVDFNEISLKAGMRVLDAGCGGGRHLCEAFRRPGIEVVGIDLGREDLRKAQGFMTLMNAEHPGRWLIAQGDVRRLPFKNSSFDVVVCSEVLEHITENRTAVVELARVLKPGGELAVTVPRFWPERICWALSIAYHEEPGGHIRIYKERELLTLLTQAGLRWRKTRYRHALHAPYWWLRCLVGHKNETFWLVKAYRIFLEWDIVRHPPLTALLDRLLNPLLGKSIVFYLKKDTVDGA